MKGKTPSLQELDSLGFVARLRAGEETAFHELDRELNTWFTNYVHKKYAMRREDAQDVAQEAFFIIYTKIYSFDASKGNFTNWAFQILRNRCIDWLRKQNRLATISWDSLTAGEIAETSNEEPSSPDDLSPLERLPGMVRQAVLKLPGRYQQLIGLLLLGVRDNQIMETLQIKSSSTLRSLRSRAITKLRKIVDQQSGG